MASENVSTTRAFVQTGPASLPASIPSVPNDIIVGYVGETGICVTPLILRDNLLKLRYLLGLIKGMEEDLEYVAELMPNRDTLGKLDLMEEDMTVEELVAQYDRRAVNHE